MVSDLSDAGANAVYLYWPNISIKRLHLKKPTERIFFNLVFDAAVRDHNSKAFCFHLSVSYESYGRYRYNFYRAKTQHQNHTVIQCFVHTGL